MKMIFFLLYSYYLITEAYSTSPRVDPLVKIDQGLVRGKLATNGNYSEFLGIPYAKVDMENPFGESLPPDNFKDTVFDAYSNAIVCPQTAITIADHDSQKSEDESLDCLRINIYVPYKASSQKPLPVLVWTYGGIFIFGDAKRFGPRHLVKHDIIVVTFNYRLGAYGFMCLDDPSVPGNQGLKDQLAALKWVKKNIAAFGGNPNEITLAGQSAGSTSVLLQLYSKKEKLFDKIIAQSGTPFSTSMFVKADVEAAQKLARYLGFNISSTQEALAFLSKQNHSLVTEASHSLGLVLKPCQEKSFSGVENFVESKPYSLSNVEKIEGIPMLIGNTNLEYLKLIAQRHGKDYFKKDIFYDTLKNAFEMDDEQLRKASEIVRHYYIGDESISEDIFLQAVEFNSDFFYVHPAQDTLVSLLEQKAGPVYQYLFSYVQNSSVPGATHAAELNYLWDYASKTNYSDKDLEIVEIMTTLWTNFVKFGNPTPSNIPVSWSPITKDTRPYLLIDTDVRMENRFFKERMAFWDLFYATYGQYSILVNKCDTNKKDGRFSIKNND